MKEIKKGNISILREIFGILGQPVAEGHDCKKHEDAANADDENDHHDHRVAVALFHYSHNIKDKRAVACRGLDAGQSEEKKSLKKCREKWRHFVKSRKIRAKA